MQSSTGLWNSRGVLTICVFLFQVLVDKIFLVVLIYCDIMGLNFLFLVKNVGSWLRIGSSVSHYVISQTITLFLVLLYFLSGYLTSTKLKKAEHLWKLNEVPSKTAWQASFAFIFFTCATWAVWYFGLYQWTILDKYCLITALIFYICSFQLKIWIKRITSSSFDKVIALAKIKIHRSFNETLVFIFDLGLFGIICRFHWKF